MTAFGLMAWLFLAWSLCAPASFGRHLAAIADAFEAERTKLRAGRETAP